MQKLLGQFNISVQAEMGYSVQDNLLRVLLCCCLRLLRPSLGMPTVQTLGEITMRRINWTREGVSGYTPSEPLYVVLHDILKFQCEEQSSDFVYLLRGDAYKNVSGACSSSGIVEESTLSSLCRPPPIADCRQTQPEKTVDGANETAHSCYVASFIPGMSYYLASFPSSGDTSRCLFALPLKVCPLYDSG
ncbi:hypothetical protein GBAR_LOCUS23641 [Geodia barretti]|uniref:Uncharacterized protein n=1 Tax=Geodia barretti TaxID=519541 RepID=A0AA35X3D7_GEOBA|nr:hypothetical protein GBAR_LOCUS23641 [Geodia barretti]